MRPSATVAVRLPLTSGNGSGFSVGVNGGTARRWTERLFEPVDIAPLVWLRVVFGLLMFVEIGRFFANDWIRAFYVEPAMLFKYHGFEWVRPFPEPWLHLHFVALAVLALCIAIGFLHRLAAALFFIGFGYVFLLDESRYLNHFYLICLMSFLLSVVPAHRAFSLDALRRPGWRCGTCPAWALWLLRAQVCVVFLFAGVAKLNGDWLRAEPMRMWLARRVEMPLIGPLLGMEWMAWFFSYGGLLFDLLIVPMLLWRRARWWAFGAVAAFNLINGWVFSIGIFPWLMLGSTLILFGHGWPHPVRSLWTARQGCRAGAGSRTGACLFLAVYLGLQVLVPLRHWLYPGPVQWTEEGHRFSWRMKLRDKQSELKLELTEPVSGESAFVDPLDYLTVEQYGIVAGQPDMILQLCHHIAEDFRSKGVPGIQVRAHAFVSLNGRPPRLLVDPAVDLAAEPRRFAHSRWILDLDAPISPRREPACGTGRD